MNTVDPYILENEKIFTMYPTILYHMEDLVTLFTKNHPFENHIKELQKDYALLKNDLNIARENVELHSSGEIIFDNISVIY